MVEKLLLDALPLVTTPLALVAFLAAAVVWMHAKTVGRAERLIRSAPDGDRSTLVAGALEILDVGAKHLTREQRFALALEILAQRRHRNILVFWLSMVFGVGFAGLAAYAFAHPNLEKDVVALLSEDKRPAVMPILNQNGIFEATDKGVVEYLAVKATPSAARDKLGDLAYDRAAQELYNSIASVRELRARAERRVEPFTVLGEQVQATVPDRVDHPWQFFVNVPIDSKYANRTVKVVNLANPQRYIRVFARGAIDPTNGQTRIHLNREQARYLDVGFPATGRLEVSIRETVEPIYDPNCSDRDRPRNLLPKARELCRQGDSVSIAYLQGFLSR